MSRIDNRQRKRLGRGLGSLMAAPVRIDLPEQESTTPTGDTPPPNPPPPTPTTNVPRETPAPGTPAPGLSATGISTSGTSETPRLDPPDPGASTPTASPGAGLETDPPSEDVIRSIPIASIRPNTHQPRQVFDEAALDQLAASIRADGLMQPILVRPVGRDQYELIAGERRWRAAQRIPLKYLPALVRAVDDRTAAEWALIENLQREDLGPLERSEAFRTLIDRFGLTHQQVAERVGQDRSSVTNLLRLNDLDEVCKECLRVGAVGLGHARTLLAIANISQRQQLCREAVRRQWSVRELERRVKALGGGGMEADRSGNPGETREQGEAGEGGGAARGSFRAATANADVARLERGLAAHLGTRVRIVKGRRKGGGKLVLEFYDLDQFEGLMKRLGYNDET